MGIKIVSLNIEGQKHLETVKAFLAREGADVVCLMEVYESDLALIAREYPYTIYAPNNVIDAVSGITLGVAVLSKVAIDSSEILYCDGKSRETIEVVGEGTHSPVVVMARVGEYQIGATHFTWTPQASVTDKQRDHIERLLALTAGREVVLCGDFNIPRGSEMYRELAGRYKDNIPREIATTIDPDLHRANWQVRGRLALVVDYVWSTPRYSVRDVRVVSGVSDHCALVCDVSKV